MKNPENKKPEVFSRLGPSVHLQGNIDGSEDLVIDGQVEGKIAVAGHRVIISASARIRGEITAHEVIIEGSLEGNITATGKVTVKAKAVLNGDVSAGSVAVEDGAKFKGAIKIISSAPSQARPS